MHEGILCREILDISLKAAQENDLKKICRITLVKGVNSCIQGTELQMFFELAKIGTIAENAQLVIETDSELEGYGKEYIKDIEGD